METDLHHPSQKINWSSFDFKHHSGFQKCISSSDFKEGIVEGEKEGNENEIPPEIGNKEQRKSFMSTSSSKKKNKNIRTDKNDPFVGIDRNPHGQKVKNSDWFLSPVKPDVDEGNDFVSTPAGTRPYDPTTNYLSPRPKFLRYDPDRSREIFLRIEREKKNLDGDGSDTSSCSSPEPDDLNQGVSFFESPPPPLESPNQEDESSPSTDSHNLNLPDEEEKLESENEDEDEEDDDIYMEEKGSSVCSLVLKSILLLGFLILSSHSILEMSSSPTSSSFVPNRRESRVNYLDYYFHAEGSYWDLQKLCPKTTLEMFIGLPGTCPNMKFNDSVILGIEEEQQEEEEEEEGLQVPGSVNDHFNGVQKDQFKDSVTMGGETGEDLQVPECVNGYFRGVLQSDDMFELKVEEQEQVDDVDLMSADSGFLGTNQREETSHFSLNDLIKSTISPPNLVMAILALAAVAICGVLTCILYNKKQPHPEVASLPSRSKSDGVEASGLPLTTSEKKENEEEKVTFSLSGSISSSLNASIGQREFGIHPPKVEFLGEFSIEEAEEVQSPFSQVKKKRSDATVKSMFSSSKEFSTAESNSHARFNLSDKKKEKKKTKGSFVNGEKDDDDDEKVTLMTPVRRSTRIRIRKQINNTP